MTFTALAKDEIWRGEGRELSRCVDDVLQMFRVGSQPSPEVVNLAVYEAVCEIVASRLQDFIRITEHPTVGTAYHCTAIFLDEAFSRAVTVAAYERLFN